jgi:hypothetical protein
VAGEADPFGGAQAIEVGDRQRHDQADLVDQHEPIEAGDVDAEAECCTDRHQQAK